jgi:AcrR family transcriptional regulator
MSRAPLSVVVTALDMGHDGRMSTRMTTPRSPGPPSPGQPSPGPGPSGPIDRTGDPVHVPVGAPRTARDWARLRLTDQILAAARAQLATEGAAGLSLRAIAREMGMSSSAIYRYFASRDELLTALIIEAYNGLGEATEMAEAAVDRADLIGRFATACNAVRDWALAHPHQYALIYGSPVPGYKAPTDTVLPATRVTTVMTMILVDGLTSRRLNQSVLADDLDSEAVAAMAPIMAQLPPEFPPALFARGLLIFAGLFGAISFELFGQFHNVIEETPQARTVWFNVLVARWADTIGIQ